MDMAYYSYYTQIVADRREVSSIRAPGKQKCSSSVGLPGPAGAFRQSITKASRTARKLMYVINKTGEAS